MLLSIDAAKVQEQLQNSRPNYVVTLGNLEPIPVIATQLSTSSVLSTVVGMSPDVERARARLLELRRSLLEKGIPSLTPDALDREIDEARGR